MTSLHILQILRERKSRKSNDKKKHYFGVQAKTGKSARAGSQSHPMTSQARGAPQEDPASVIPDEIPPSQK
jgi:hypothetical protein